MLNKFLNFSFKFKIPNNLLHSSTIIYISIPYFIFFLGWIKLIYSVPATALLIWAIYKTNKTNWFNPTYWSEVDVPLIKCLLSWAMIFAWLYFSGVGAVGGQNGDYQKHMAMITDLVRADWPVTYGLPYGERQIQLIYYIGYYLPATLVGKFFGYEWALRAIFVWSFFGLILSFHWIYKLIGKNLSVVATFVFIMFSGLDFIGQYLVHNKWAYNGEHIEWWAGYWQFSGMTSLLVWVPQHAITGWILTPLIYYSLKNKENENVLFFNILGLLWSPFVTLGLIPLSLFGVAYNKFKNVLSIQNIIVSLVIGIICSIFYISKIPDIFSGFLVNFNSFKQVAPRALLFLSLEVWIIAIFFIFHFRNKQNFFHVTLWFCILMLPLFLVYKIGMYNDLCMRGSIGIIYLFTIGAIKFLLDYKGKIGIRVAFVVVLLVGFVNTWNELKRTYGFWKYNIKFGQMSVLEMEPIFSFQYTSKKENLYTKYLSQKENPSYQKINKKLIQELRNRKEL